MDGEAWQRSDYLLAVGLSFYGQSLHLQPPKNRCMGLPSSPHPTSTLKCPCWYPFSGSHCHVASRTQKKTSLSPFILSLRSAPLSSSESLPLILFLGSVLCGTRKESWIECLPRPALGCRHTGELHFTLAPNTACDISQITHRSRDSYFLTDWLNKYYCPSPRVSTTSSTCTEKERQLLRG